MVIIYIQLNLDKINKENIEKTKNKIFKINDNLNLDLTDIKFIKRGSTIVLNRHLFISYQMI